MRRTTVVASTLALVLAGAGAASASSGTGSVVDTIAATVVSGPLTLSGVGASVALSTTPGVWSSSTGATALTVVDATGTTNGWAVTATYSDPAGAVTPLGASNVEVTAANPTGAITGSALALATDSPLTSPVTVASTGLGTGLGTTVMTASYKVKVPATAAVGTVYGATVTYTVASMR